MIARNLYCAALFVAAASVVVGCAHSADADMNVSMKPSLAEAESLRVVPLDAPPKLFFKNVSPASMGADLKAQRKPKLPDDVRHRATTSELAGSYVVGVDLDGHVSRIDVVESIPGGDSAIVATLLKWQFPPQQERVRFLQRFVFKTSGL
jgi:hypothetical protein